MLELTTEGTRGGLGAPSSKGDGAQSKEVISSDFETFLKMLTTQLEHQDPLDPLDSNEFAVQLATFSSVEQQALTNELLGELLQAGDSGSHATWIGLDALSDAPLRFEGAPLPLEFDPDGGAAAAALVVTDEAGLEVGRQPVDPASGRATWDGTDGSGTPLPEGRYRFALHATQADGATSTAPVLGYARVLEVRPGPEGTRLVLDGGTEVAAEDVRSLRAPAEPEPEFAPGSEWDAVFP